METFTPFLLHLLVLVGQTYGYSGRVANYSLAFDDVPSILFNSDGTLKVSFNDGSEDVVKLVHSFPKYIEDMDEDRIASEEWCFYRGRLSNEPDVHVSLNGCPGSSNFDIMFMSRRARGYMHQVRDGIVARLELEDKDSSSYVADINESIQGSMKKVNLDRDLPSSFTLKVHVIADAEYTKRFGSSFKQKVLSTMNRVNGLFKLNTLVSATNIEVDPVKIDSTSLTFDAITDQTVNAHHVIKTLEDMDANAYAFLTIGDHNTPITGRASFASACESWFGNREDSSLVAHTIVQNQPGSAITIAHELGHTLGFKHDFEGDYSNGVPKTIRYNEFFQPCTDDDGVMDYVKHVYPKWTECSLDDFYDFMNNQIEKNGFFCLALQ